MQFRFLWGGEKLLVTVDGGQRYDLVVQLFFVHKCLSVVVVVTLMA